MGKMHIQLSTTQIIKTAKSKSTLKMAKDLSWLQPTESFLAIGGAQHDNGEHISKLKKGNMKKKQGQVTWERYRQFSCMKKGLEKPKLM